MRYASYGVVAAILLVSLLGCRESSSDSSAAANKPAPAPPLPPAPPAVAPTAKKPAGHPKKTHPAPAKPAKKKKAQPAKKNKTPTKPKAAQPKPTHASPPPGRRYATKEDRYGPDQPKVRINEYYLTPSWGQFLSDNRLLLTAKVKFSAQRAEGPYWFFVDPETNVVLDRVDVAARGNIQLQAAPDGTAAVTLAPDKAYYFDLKRRGDPERIATDKVGKKKIGKVRFRCTAFSPDGKLVVLGGQTKAFLWNAESRKMVRFIPTTDPVELVCISADSKFAALNSAGKVGVWDLKTGQLRVCPDRSLYGCSAIVFMPDGRNLLAATESLGSVRLLVSNVMRIIHLATGRVTKAFKAQEPISCVAVSADGKRVVSGSPSGKVVLWNASTGARIRELYRHKKRVRRVDISPDGRFVLSISDAAILALTPVAAKNKKRLVLGK